MIVLDANVVSELMRAQPNQDVIDWVDEQAASETFLAAVTVAEVLYGMTRTADGKRKATLETSIKLLLNEDFSGRILSFDDLAAEHYADLVAGRERQGRPIGMADGQIAAICRGHGATLATRNTKDFEGTGVDLVNPWNDHHA